jgi:hypothetical protein
MSRFWHCPQSSPNERLGLCGHLAARDCSITVNAPFHLDIDAGAQGALSSISGIAVALMVMARSRLYRNDPKECDRFLISPKPITRDRVVVALRPIPRP